MKSQAANVKDYLASLPEDRRTEVEQVRKVILKNLDSDYEECLHYGMIIYAVSPKLYPDGQHPDPNVPVSIAGIASQKNYISLYLGGTYCGCGEVKGKDLTPDMEWFRNSWQKTGKKLNMGKACVRFKKSDDLALDVIGEAVKRLPAKECVLHYEKINAGKKKKK